MKKTIACILMIVLPTWVLAANTQTDINGLTSRGTPALTDEVPAQASGASSATKTTWDAILTLYLAQALTFTGNNIFGNADTDTLTLRSLLIGGNSRAVWIAGSAPTPTYATGTNELYVGGDIESGGNVYGAAGTFTGAMTAGSFTTPQSAASPDRNLRRGPGTNGRGVYHDGPAAEPATTWGMTDPATEPAVGQIPYIISGTTPNYVWGWKDLDKTILTDNHAPTAAQMHGSLNTISAGLATSSGVVLPVSVQGMHGEILAVAATSMGVHANLNGTIYLNGTAVSWPNGVVNSSAANGDLIDMTCITAGTWRKTNTQGTWVSRNLHPEFTTYQNFGTATTGYDNSETWTEYAEAGGVVEAADTTAPILKGTQQLKIYAGDSGSTSSTRKNISSASDCWAHFMIYSTNYGQVNGTFFKLSATTTERLALQFNSDGKIRIYHGTGNTLSATALTNSTAYHIWAHYIAGSGTDGQAYVYVSTSNIFPGSAFVSLATGGTSTTAVDRIYLQSIHQATLFFDQIITSPSAIGNVY